MHFNKNVFFASLRPQVCPAVVVVKPTVGLACAEILLNYEMLYTGCFALNVLFWKAYESFLKEQYLLCVANSLKTCWITLLLLLITTDLINLPTIVVNLTSSSLLFQKSLSALLSKPIMQMETDKSLRRATWCITQNGVRRLKTFKLIR